MLLTKIIDKNYFIFLSSYLNNIYFLVINKIFAYKQSSLNIPLRIISYQMNIRPNPYQSTNQQYSNLPPFNPNNMQQHQQLKYVHNVDVKNSIAGTRSKTLQILPQTNKLIVYANQNDRDKGKFKQFPLNQVTYVHQNNQSKGKRDCLHIDTNNDKKYSIKGNNSAQIADQLEKSQKFYQINQFQQQPVTFVPKQINYVTPFQSGLGQFQKILIPPNQPLYQPVFLQQNQPQQSKQDLSKYPRRKFYFDPEDWKIDREKGTIIFINAEKKANQKNVIKFVLKKFLTTGSFMGISFPTFVMKPESILESYAKAIGAAPLLFEDIINPVQRMKKFICLIHSFSVLFVDLTKPFNPPIGQTFQAKIANGNYYAEQICHHPPISAFLYQGKGYKLSGAFEMTANLGPNSATGVFEGDLKLEFDDGMIYTGRIPGGEFSGFIIGDQKFEAYGSIYAYNNKKLVCSISTPQKNNYFQGYIGKLKPKYEQQFFRKVTQPGRYGKFPFFQRKCFDTVFSFMQMSYNHRILFNQSEYFNLEQQKYLPFLPYDIQNPKILLKSDSRFRKDIPLRKQLKFDQAQEQKQKLEDEQRYLRKLRAKYDPSHHKSA